MSARVFSRITSYDSFGYFFLNFFLGFISGMDSKSVEALSYVFDIFMRIWDYKFN
jgi:hypothetical protein